ncbi:MAG TPA: DUF998 domain-containing protein [Trueperaceae bacterium]|nr:DUF998 domain-containing protein [Trueperaceae bacterium]
MTLPVVFGAACWALSIVYFIVQAIAQAASTRPYSMATNVISDLGNTACGAAMCSPLHGLMNVTFVVVGAFHWIGAIATYRAWPRRWLSFVARALLALSGAFLVVVGLSPENLKPYPHVLGAMVGLVALNLAMIALAGAIGAARRWLGGMALVAGTAGLLGFALLVSGTGPPGATERLADYPGAVMVIVLGVYLLVAAVSEGRRRLHAGAR